MELFSQRQGIKPVRQALQLGSMDASLRSRLWDLLVGAYLGGVTGYTNAPGNRRFLLTLHALWHSYFKDPVDTIPLLAFQAYQEVRSRFFASRWNEVYDIIEFVASVDSADPTSADFVASCNVVLEEELSAYRFVGGKVVPVSSPEEVAAIEEARQVTDRFTPVRDHLGRALELLADRKKPDYRNSIKESISAVESLSIILTGKQDSSLSDALRKLERAGMLHPALKGAFEKLYGYTSDADGIRHALLGETSLDFDDAKFMLVTCSAFVNYAVAKAARAGAGG